METINGFPFVRLHFDADGKPIDQQEETDLKGAAANATDVILIAHGFRNDEADATSLYEKFLGNLRLHISGSLANQLGLRRFVVGGIFWPSKKFDEDVKFEGATAALDAEPAEKEEVRAKLDDLEKTVACPEQKPRIAEAKKLLDSVKGNPEAQNRFVENVLSLLDDDELGDTEGVEEIRSTSGSALLNKLNIPPGNPVGLAVSDDGGVPAVDQIAAPVSDEGGAEGLADMAGSIFGKIGTFLNLTTWYTMKNRSGVVGANGVEKIVRALKSDSDVRVHLVGHSLGGRMMASCSKALSQNPLVQPDSVSLLEAAFSHFGFSSDNGEGKTGFFVDVIKKKVVKGPFVATFSAHDSVVGKAYAVVSRLADDNVEAIGDKNDPFGGIGHNGAQRTAEAIFDKLHDAGTAYQFQTGKLLNLDGSGGLIMDHGDVTNPAVTYAVAAAIAAT
ncbi:MAG TPA: hypothetical protein VKB79_30645 [Bryobacteraceae bacterium]|nr:hypothetical protein [Bryobacteraceae bacterium]